MLVKEELTRPTLYSPSVKTKVSADATSFWTRSRIVATVSWQLETSCICLTINDRNEQRYAQIEKEALATTWACEKFSNYLLGSHLEIEIDHKPLVPLLSSKHLDDLPPRVLRFRLRLARFNYSITHVPGKLLYTADTLSRTPLPTTVHGSDLQQEVETFVNAVISSLPTMQTGMDTYRRAQKEDPVCLKVMEFCRSGWPNRHSIPAAVKAYWKARNSLSIHNNLLLFNSLCCCSSSLAEKYFGENTRRSSRNLSMPNAD